MAEKTKTLNMAIDQIERQYGKGSIMKMSNQANMKYESICNSIISYYVYK